MERLRKSFRRSKNKNKESDNSAEIQSVFSDNEVASIKPDNKSISRFQRIRQSIRLNKKKYDKSDVFNEDKNTGLDDKEDNKEEIDSVPLEKSSKFRKSFKKKKKDENEPKEKKKSKKKGNSKWETDEERVRSNHCEFKIKYLGSLEVHESRGMEVCESAIKSLKNSKGKKVKGTLHVSGDGLRVVDSKKQGMLVDQVIEKVSFCAPDRNFSRGFAYISRDGTSRRWLCHGFMARKDSGERLSHAVGVAFAVCLEKKQARECEGVTGTYNEDEGTFTRFGSFRQGTITERLQNPQEFKESAAKIEVGVVENPFAIARPKPGDARASMRGFGEIKGASPFKRGDIGYTSLRVNELPSNVSRKEKSRISLILEETFENEETKNEINQMILEMSRSKISPVTVEEQESSLQSAPIPANSTSSDSPICIDSSKIGAIQDISVKKNFHGGLPGVIVTQASSITSNATFDVASSVQSIHMRKDSPPTIKSPPSPEGTNPWDLVPDQPKLKIHSRSNSKTENVKTDPILIQNNNIGDKWLASLSNKVYADDQEVIESWNEPAINSDSLNIDRNCNEDPLELEWRALATRNSNKPATTNNTNPFRAFV